MQLLDLQEAIGVVYQRGFFHLSIDYQAVPPPPSLTPGQQAWWQAR